MTMAAHPHPPPASPFSLAGLDRLPAWRDSLVWPVDIKAFARRAIEIVGNYLTFVSALPDGFERRVAIAAGANLSGLALTLAEGALFAQGQAELGLHVVGAPPEIDRLGGRSEAREDRYDQGFTRSVHTLKTIERPFLRRLARTQSWCPLHRLPATLVRPQATAVSHNPILRDYLSGSAQRVDFRHVDVLMAEVRRRAGEPAIPARCADLGDKIAAAMSEIEGLAEPFVSRLRALYLDRLTPVLARAASDLLALESVRRLPCRVIAGSNGYFPTRELCAEVRRRGGSVMSFDHGGTTGISERVPVTAIVELSTSDHFVLGTQGMADLVKSARTDALVQAYNRPRITGHTGDPTFKRFCLDGDACRRTRPKVLYPTVRFRGFRQYGIADLPDPVYLDFQFHLVEALKKLKIDLLCKPHPEGVLEGKPHPLEDVAPTAYDKFETYVAGADVFLFDSPYSTVFGEALCTDRRIVLIDYGCWHFNPGVAPGIHERCRIVTGRFDARNRLRVDPVQLAEAILSEGGRPDPGYFRALLAGL